MLPITFNEGLSVINQLNHCIWFIVYGYITMFTSEYGLFPEHNMVYKMYNLSDRKTAIIV